MADSPWTERASLAEAAPDSRQPAVAVLGEVPHVVWVHGRTIYHSYWTGSSWAQALKAGTGERPALAATPDGRLHCVFTGTLFGKSEIYHVAWDGATWTLPQLVSRTSGLSLNPAVAVGPDGVLHVVWSDTTPGRPVIYHGRQHGALWTSVPIPNARGGQPTVAVTPDGSIHVAWQNRLPSGSFEVLASTCRTGRWEMPQNVSDFASGHSVNAKLAATPGGFCHIVWQEDRDGIFVVRAADRRAADWSAPVNVSRPGVDARLPLIASGPETLVHVVWLEGRKLAHRARPAPYDAGWLDAEVACTARGGINGAAVAVGQTGALHAVWCEYVQGGILQLFAARRAPIVAAAPGAPVG